MVKTKGWDTEQKALTPIHGTVCLIRVCQALTNLCVLHVKSFIMLKHQRTPNRLDQKKKKSSCHMIVKNQMHKIEKEY